MQSTGVPTTNAATPARYRRCASDVCAWRRRASSRPRLGTHALLAQLPAAIYTYSPEPRRPHVLHEPVHRGAPRGSGAGLPRERRHLGRADPPGRPRAIQARLRVLPPHGRSRTRASTGTSGRTAASCGSTTARRRSATTDGTPLYIQGVMFDITPTKEAELRMQHLAHHDPLTGLPNRAMFEEHLELALARARRATGSAVAVLFLDLDEFKPVNDVHGHGTGDEVLKQVAARLRSAVRDADLVARRAATIPRAPGRSVARRGRRRRRRHDRCRCPSHRRRPRRAVRHGRRRGDAERERRLGDLSRRRARRTGAAARRRRRDVPRQARATARAIDRSTGPDARAGPVGPAEPDRSRLIPGDRERSIDHRRQRREVALSEGGG